MNRPAPGISRTFAALADPTRRAMLARLEREEKLSISELAKPFAIKLPAVMKHLDVLADAKLIARTKSGRTVDVRILPEPLLAATAWLTRYKRFWTPRLDRLVAYAEEKEIKERGKSK